MTGLLLFDTPDRYGLISRAFHWCMAYLLLWQVMTILLWRFVGASPFVDTIMAFGPYHRTVGLITVVLVAQRAAWALWQRRRRPRHAAGWHGRAAKLGHAILYYLMFTVPALALLRDYGSGKGLNMWKMQVIPATNRRVDWMVNLADVLHSPLSWLFFILMVGHIAIALCHKRMIGYGILGRMAGGFCAGKYPDADEN